MRSTSCFKVKYFLAMTSLTGILNLYFLTAYIAMDSDVSCSDHGHPAVIRRQISSIDSQTEEERYQVGPNYGHLELMNFDLKEIIDRYTTLRNTFGKELERVQYHFRWKRKDRSNGEFKRSFVTPSCGISQFLLIQVHSRPHSFMKRESIRLSWGNQENAINQGSWIKPERSWKTIFLVGKSNNSRINTLLQQESQFYGDIVIGDFMDTFRHLPRKMLLGMEWSLKYCRPKYVLKTDEDCFINIIPLVMWLSDHHIVNGSKALYIGKVQHNMQVVRDKDHRYYVSRKNHPESFFKPYVSGGGYLFSGNLLNRLYEASQAIPMIPVEDASFGRYMDFVGVKATDDPRFLPFVSCDNSYETLFERPLCHFKDPFVVHGVSDVQQIYMHYNVLIMNFIPTVCSYVEYQSKQDYLNKPC